MGLAYVAIVAAFFTFTMFTSITWLQLAAVTLTSASTAVWVAPFLAWLSSNLSGRALAIGIALVNSVGNTGGIWGPQLLSYSMDKYGNIQLASVVFLILIGVALCISVILFVRHHKTVRKSLIVEVANEATPLLVNDQDK